MRFEIVILLAVLIDLSLLVLALVLLMRPAFRVKAYCLLAYAVTALNSDYINAIEAIDRALGRDGALLRRIAFPSAINFVSDLSGLIALLIAIWLFLWHVMRARREDFAASRSN